MNNPELQQQAVAQLLQEVPLIDGYEKELSSLIWSVLGYLKFILNVTVFVEIYITPEYI